jgi:hypothetical protein
LLAPIDPAFGGAVAPASETDPGRRAHQRLDDAAQLLNRLERTVRGTRGRMAEIALL